MHTAATTATITAKHVVGRHMVTDCVEHTNEYFLIEYLVFCQVTIESTPRVDTIMLIDRQAAVVFVAQLMSVTYKN